MPNSKQRVTKRKQRKNQNRIKNRRVESLANAKKSTLRTLNEQGSLPKIYLTNI